MLAVFERCFLSFRDAQHLCEACLWTSLLWQFYPNFFLVDFQQIYKMDLSTRYSVLKLLHRTCSVHVVVIWSSPSHCHSIIIVLIKLLIWALNYLSEPKQHLTFCTSVVDIVVVGWLGDKVRIFAICFVWPSLVASAIESEKSFRWKARWLPRYAMRV